MHDPKPCWFVHLGVFLAWRKHKTWQAKFMQSHKISGCHLWHTNFTIFFFFPSPPPPPPFFFFYRLWGVSDLLGHQMACKSVTIVNVKLWLCFSLQNFAHIPYFLNCKNHAYISRLWLICLLNLMVCKTDCTSFPASTYILYAQYWQACWDNSSKCHNNPTSSLNAPKSPHIHWASKETYYFFRATLTKIYPIIINHICSLSKLHGGRLFTAFNNYSFNFNGGLCNHRTSFCLRRTPSPGGEKFLWFLKKLPLAISHFSHFWLEQTLFFRCA